MKNKKWNAEFIYINEIIRINYKCNWACKFCNVLKTNNYWKTDISNNEVVFKILELVKKYSNKELKNLTLSFSGWEPTLNKNLINYIKLAKQIWIWIVQIQTNWTRLFKEKKYINKLINAWLDEIFLAQHSWLEEINKKLWTYYNINDFIDWVNYINKNKINEKIWIAFNIVVNKINLSSINEYIIFLDKIWFLNLLPIEDNNWFKNTRRISFWLVQPNWYAKINWNEVLLEYNDKQINEIHKIIKLCKKYNIYTDFHFTSPPLCILNYPDFNLEYIRLKKLEKDKDYWNVNKSNLESYKFLWKEKQKFEKCKECKYHNYCLWFYKNWIEFVWEEYINKKINKFIKNYE
jgi:uncharacterized radical SAM superfamily Fe-S cluster-containing enzyme